MPGNKGIIATAKRTAWNKAVEVLHANGMKVRGVDAQTSENSLVTLTNGYLRTEAVLDPNNTNYNFGILTTEPSTGGGTQPFATEQRLRMQDVFFAYDYGFYVVCPATAGGNTNFQNQLMTFPNPQFFGAFGLNLDLFQGIWTQGKMSLEINNNNVIPAWPLKRHMVIPQTQILVPSGNIQFNQNDFDDDGLSAMEPNIILNGGNNNQLNINYPISLANMGIGASTFRLVCWFDGFLAQNASTIMGKLF